MASSVLQSSAEKTNGFKLMRLIVDGGTEALRNIFLNIHPGNLHNVLVTHHSTLFPLFKAKKIITKPQWDKLYPHPPRIPNIQEFDITILVVLFRNICGLSAPSTGWNAMPSSTDKSRQANIVRIKLFRNNFFGHVPGTDVSRLDFEARWVEVTSTLIGLGLSQLEIDRLKAEECGEEEVNRVRGKWSQSDREIVSKLDKVLHTLSYESSKQVKSLSDDIINKNLHRCDFDKEIQILFERYTKGTREWVFQQVSTWLNDKLSDNAFIISAQAGMGKSTMAAVICKRFPEHFAACHFFQYNNSFYNNPKILLQSLAWQLCNVFPEFKQNLASIICGDKGKILHEMNIEGLFSMLFEEPFANIPDPGRHFLIVIDALDECRQDEKQKLVHLITNHFHKFPKYIRFLITTRSETDLASKFQGLNPMFLERDDARNVCDIRLLFEDKLKIIVEHVRRDEFIKNLVEKSEGLMLYASFLCKLSDDSSIISNPESLPRGIEEIYESYFNRLENEFKSLGIEEEKFLSLLSVIAVAKQPLPLALIEMFLSSEKDSLSARRTLQKLISCFSSLLVIKDDCVSFFHKSVKDWLTKPNHCFSIHEEYGHKTLANICASQMETLKQNGIRLTFDRAVEYALQNGTSHIVQAEIKERQTLTNLIHYVTDLEIVHTSVCIDVFIALNNLESLASCNMYNSLDENIQTTIKTLISVIGKFIYILKDIPQSFLQHVVNENNKDLSSKASDLLAKRYRGLAYFEYKNKQEKIEKAVIGRITTTDCVSDVDISPLEDFLICGYIHGGVELFSLSNFKSLWKIDEKTIGLPSSAVFHPFKKVIFPGQLDSVLNFEGKFEPGPLKEGETYPKFRNCCFSYDESKMATSYDNHLTVWNLHENNKIVTFSCRSTLRSISFSANNRFLATTDLNVLCVYDTENAYSMASQYVGMYPKLISTFNSECWYCHVAFGEIKIVKHDLTNKPVPKRLKSMPMNQKAVTEFQACMESYDRTWLDNLDYDHFFILRNENALVFTNFENELKLVRFAEFIQNSKKVQKLTSNSSISSCYVSVNGKYVYTSTQCGTLYVGKLTSAQSVELKKVAKFENRFVFPVINGVFLVNKYQPHPSPLRPLRYSGSVRRCTPELWNSEVSQLLFRFPEQTDAWSYLSVAEDLIACVTLHSWVLFLNVLRKEIAARVHFHTRSVMACSSQYHVLAEGCNTLFLLQGENIDLDLKTIVKDLDFAAALKLITAVCFSPNGRFLAVLSDEVQKLCILDIVALNMVCKIPLYSKGFQVQFIDEEHILCGRYNDCLCLMNIKNCNMLACINVGMGDIPWRFSVSRSTGTIVVYPTEYVKEFKIIQLWLPNQRQDA